MLHINIHTHKDENYTHTRTNLFFFKAETASEGRKNIIPRGHCFCWISSNESLLISVRTTPGRGLRYVYVGVGVFTYVYVCVYICIHMYMCECVYRYVPHSHIYICTCVSMHMYIYIYVYIHILCQYKGSLVLEDHWKTGCWPSHTSYLLRVVEKRGICLTSWPIVIHTSRIRFKRCHVACLTGVKKYKQGFGLSNWFVFASSVHKERKTQDDSRFILALGWRWCPAAPSPTWCTCRVLGHGLGRHGAKGLARWLLPLWRLIRWEVRRWEPAHAAFVLYRGPAIDACK
jgi:hypothetical protein